MIYLLILKWITNPVLITLATKESPIHTIPFPAVTICPETKISPRCFNYTYVVKKRISGESLTLSAEESSMFDHMALLCKPENHLKSGNSPNTGSKTAEVTKMDDYAEFLEKCRSVKLDLSYCKWMGKTVNCNQVLTPILTDEGLCYSFNMLDVRDIYSETNRMPYYRESKRNPLWNPDTGYPDDVMNEVYPHRAFSNGAKNSLVVALFTKKDEIEYSCRDFALQGIRVTLHTPSRIPRPSETFFSVGLDRLTTVAVTPSLMTTTTTVKDYDPEDRNCYFGTERKLKYFKLYSQSNCELECLTNFTIQTCGCVHFHMPRDNNTEICDIDRRICLEEARVNYPISLLKEGLSSRDAMVQQNTTEASNCNCLPMCTDLTYNAEISTGEWDFSKQVDAEYIKEYHASAVEVFFKSTYFRPVETSESYGIIDFISASGGLLGLFVGFYLFSLAEIIYFLSTKLVENTRRLVCWAGEKKERE